MPKRRIKSHSMLGTRVSQNTIQLMSGLEHKSKLKDAHLVYHLLKAAVVLPRGLWYPQPFKIGTRNFTGAACPEISTDPGIQLYIDGLRIRY